MKLKTDFVTNSSSTCFVVFIPDKYVPTDNELLSVIDKEITWWDWDEEDNAAADSNDFLNIHREQILDLLKQIKNGDTVYKDEYGDGIDYRIYSVLDSLLTNKGFGLSGVELGSGGMDCIVGIKESKIIDIITENTELTEFCKIARSENEKK